MTKYELITILAKSNPYLYKKDLERFVNTFFEEISKTLSQGNRVELRGFAAFSVKKRPPRIGRNPRTGDKVKVQGKSAAYFKTGKGLRDRLNSVHLQQN